MYKMAVRIIMIAGLILPAFATTLYVNDDATGLDNGSSWQDAFNDLQSALDVAGLGDEIRVAGGLYKPSKFLDEFNPDPLSVTFQLVNGVALQGGYAGEGADPNARDFDAYETVLTGDLNGVDRAYNVLVASSCEAGTILDGVTVTGASNSAILYGTLTITNCTFTGNYTYSFGGALYYVSGTLDRCKFIENSAEWAGGAIFMDFLSSLAITDCQFTGNTAVQTGGAIEGFASMTPITNCVFTENEAVVSGGAIHSLSGNQTIVGCVFARNQATGTGAEDGRGGAVMHDNPGTNRYIQCIFESNNAQVGGAVYSGNESILDFINCTLAGNGATSGSAFACDSYGQIYPSTLTITNCIAWDGGAEIWNNDNSTITVAYSDIQGGWTGTGNIDADPLFVQAPNGVDPVDLHLQIGSLCVNTGDTTAVPETLLLDLDSTPRVKGSAVDMGVYELAAVIPADVDLLPRIVYKNSFFPWMIAFITLPADYDVAAIDNTTLAITKIERLCCDDCSPIVTNLPLVSPITPWIGDYNRDGIRDLAVLFNNQGLMALLNSGFYRITVSGMLDTSEPFQGSEIICVIGH